MDCKHNIGMGTGRKYFGIKGTHVHILERCIFRSYLLSLLDSVLPFQILTRLALPYTEGLLTYEVFPHSLEPPNENLGVYARSACNRISAQLRYRIPQR